MMDCTNQCFSKQINGVCIKIDKLNLKQIDAVGKWFMNHNVKIINMPMMQPNTYMVIKCYTRPFVSTATTNKICNCYECNNLYEFMLFARKTLTLKFDCVIKPWCVIDQLPSVIKDMAYSRLRSHCLAHGYDFSLVSKEATVDSFVWTDTIEGYYFWYDVCWGGAPSQRF